jgi:endonuclease III
MRSSHLYARAKTLFLERRELFEPFNVMENFGGAEDPRLMESTGKRLGTRYPKETAKTWYLNSKRLVEKFGGDPRELFQSTSDARMLMKEITEFRGYGPKIGGMLLRAAIGLGFANVTGVEEVLVPVDIHDSRISFLTEILKFANGSENGKIDYYIYVTQVQKILLATCNSLGLEWLDMDRALWLIGSRGCVNKRCRFCPLHDVCTVGRAVVANETFITEFN